MKVLDVNVVTKVVLVEINKENDEENLNNEGIREIKIVDVVTEDFGIVVVLANGILVDRVVFFQKEILDVFCENVV